MAKGITKEDLDNLKFDIDKSIKDKLNGGSWKFEEVNRKLDSYSQTQLQAVNSLNDIGKDIKSITVLLEKHDQIIYGSPENMHKDGMLMAVKTATDELVNIKKNVGDEIKNIKNDAEKNSKVFMGVFGFVWTLIISALNWAIKK